MATRGYLRPHCAVMLHVRDIQLDNSPDTSIWRYAKQHGYDVITRDDDFLRLVLAEGFPPRVVAVQNAQVSVAKLAEFLLARLLQLEAFLGEQTEHNNAPPGEPTGHCYKVSGLTSAVYR